MTLLAFTTIYGFGVAVIAIVALFAAVFTRRWEPMFSSLAVIAGSMAIIALIAATIIRAVTT